MIRLALTLLTAFAATVVLAPMGILAWPFRRDGAVGFWIGKLWARMILGVAGIEARTVLLAEPPAGPVVFVSNHVSALDIPILLLGLPRPFRIVYKSSLLWVPLFGLFLAAARHVSIDRSRAFKARHSLAAAARRIRNGVSVALFPEGTRSGGEPMGAFKRGSFKLAVEARTPIVPVALVGVAELTEGRGLRPGQVQVRIHPALPLENGPDAIERLAGQAEAIIRKSVSEP